jgi:site-specific DNA-methyltransferase (adenine-specific)
MKYNPQGLIEINRVKKNGESKFGTMAGKRPGHKKETVQEFTNYPSDVLFFDSVGKPKHPTEKPLELFEYLVKTYTNEGDIVLDNCMGSGTTAIAALNTNRNFIGFELNENYYKSCLKRIEEFEASV